jgi:hypothetical protein
MKQQDLLIDSIPLTLSQEALKPAVQKVILSKEKISKKRNKSKEASLLSKWGGMLEQSMKAHVLKDPIELANGKVNKGFAGTSLPLFPDIRNIIVEAGALSRVLSLFGVKKQVGRSISLLKGPNHRSNRYLRFQYTRLIKSIGGVVCRSSNGPAFVKWKIIFRKLDNSKLTNKQKKLYRKKCKTFWGIGMQLIRRSHVFRFAVLMKSCGRIDRWFHRDFSIYELKNLNKVYLNIVKSFDGNLPMHRCWIGGETPSGKFKFRPLGVAPLAWRIYTRAQANILETFIANGWPTNQHAYTTGRGVHTAWEVILTKVLKAKNIFEFDFIGFFNTVKLEAVGDQLFDYGVPKYIVIHYLQLSSSDISNISVNKFRSWLNLNDKDVEDESPLCLAFLMAWKKYEYIHKFRKDFRSVGLPQGFSLSPILSVMPLIVLDEMEKVGISSLIYADDGLFYGDVAEEEYSKLAQNLLDKYNVGAKICPEKSRWVKKDNLWLHPLKFVGLIYDPEDDRLSASSRNGASLSLRVDVLGIFADENREETFCISKFYHLLIPILIHYR